MSSLPKATQVGKDLRALLEQIKPINGYYTDLQRVYGPTETAKDNAPKPYALVRPGTDTRTSTAGFQATRLRYFDIEVVFANGEEVEAALDAVHIDILRALGLGRDLPERKFPGLVDDEDEATPSYASNGTKTHSITITIGVTYVATYN
ncbi:hypothetical protein OU997_05250 [Pseudomonas sp. SL4(2022)]|uniref:hypothetical protein n=1 Tax=Pseudomonas sp. SL4(2022) TaxID=2994661 RepID=UPI00226D623F|nr:hypothetical protein [Pseudomonas sp. SL4(2022)]WAC45579.1 hypothetical protein OU997_05250 [Pseudomonas sp. SL4(2022)]